MANSSWHSCNVLYSGPDARLLWQFTRSGDEVVPCGERRTEASEFLPQRQVRKTWRNLWQRKLNVGWLPASQVFLRVVQLPACEPAELPAMVEFQLEKLSPLPVAQVVWTAEAMPGPADQPQTVIVIIAARTAVEEFLGGLETAGYLADRLDLPQLRVLLATTVEGDGVWVYPRQEGDRTLCLVAWWHGGRLQNLNLIALTNDASAGANLAEVLKQIAWAGEMEGWFAFPPRWVLVADQELASAWAPALRGLTAREPRTTNDAALAPGAIRSDTKPLEITNPPSPAKLAALSAAAATQANLMPAEFLLRYRQQFVDRLWMRGLAALGAIYAVGVLAYFGALKVLDFQKARVDDQIAAVTPSYTNALQLKARVQVLQDQLNLKFAALDCWKATSEVLPEDMTLTSLAFQRGRKLALFGTVTAEQAGKVTDFNEALSKIEMNGQPLFSQVITRSIQAGSGPAGKSTWSIDCDLTRTEVQ